MKVKLLKSLCALGLLLPALGKALPREINSISPMSSIRQFNAGSCLFWTVIRDSSGMTAYACSSSPTTYTALDGTDTLRVINQLERRITELEEKVRELSKR